MESSSQVNQEMRAIARKSSSSGQNVASATPASSPATSTGGRSTASTSAPSDGDIFYGKDCVNCNCQKLHKQFVLTSMGTLNFYKVQRKRSKQQFLCMGCHDTAMDLYEVK